MTQRDHESVLWELARLPRDGAAELTDEVLHAYRRGQLAADDARRVEIELAKSPALRARLVALAGGSQREPRKELRERVLASMGRRHRIPWRLAAALATVTLGAGLLWSVLNAPEGSAGPLPELAGSIHALAEVRGDGGGAHTAVSRPEASVRIELYVRAEPEPGLEFGLYRLAGDRLERIPAAALSARVGRGVVEMRARTADLVGPLPGTYPLWGALAWEGNLPAELRLGPGTTAEGALSRAGVRSLSLELQVLTPTEGESRDRPTEENQP